MFLVNVSLSGLPGFSMSLVNDMLNDLDERRGKKPANGNSLQWLTGRSPTKSKKRFLPLVTLFFIILIAILGFYIWKTQQVADRDSAIHLLTRSDVAATEKPFIESPVKQSVPADNSDSIVTDLPSPVVERASVRLRLLEKEAKANSVSQSEGVIGGGVEEIHKAMPTNEVHDVSHEKILVNLKEQEVGVQRAANSELRAVKTARPLTTAQLDRQTAKKANKLLKNNKMSAAEDILSEFLESQPAAVASGLLLTSIRMSQKKFDLAENLIDRLRSSNPRHVAIMTLNARLMLLTGRTAMAVEMLLSEQPPIVTHAAYYELLALAARQNEQYQLSEKTYRSLVAANGDRGDWWFGLALALDAQGSQHHARSAFLRALRTNELGSAIAEYARKRVSADMQN
ncbi:MAG: MSHA biogenesis protein MshN [Gammaproteobacteria bacterium]